MLTSPLIFGRRTFLISSFAHLFPIYCDLAQNGNIVAIFVEVRRFTANQESEGSEVWGGVIRLHLASPEINIISITLLKKVSGEKFLLNFASQQQFKQFCAFQHFIQTSFWVEWILYQKFCFFENFRFMTMTSASVTIIFAFPPTLSSDFLLWA